MRVSIRKYKVLGGAILGVLILGCLSTVRVQGKERGSQVSSNDPTFRLYSLLDSKYNGKVESFCVLADVINDPKNPGQRQQHVIGVDYNKDRGFGKLSLHIRTVAELTPEQLKAYTPKQIFDFGESDVAKFTKTDAGSFGKPGDVYFEPTTEGGALATATTTPEVQAQYDRLLTEFVLPAVEKKGN